jgi:cytochrome c peroxidase
MVRSRWTFGLTMALLALLLVGATVSKERFVGMRLENGALVPNPPPYDPNNPATGLQKAFPTEIVQPPDNPTTPEKVELGRLLFFDPILSDDNTLSCAHCHHPHLGFSDGLPRSRGRGGQARDANARAASNSRGAHPACGTPSITTANSGTDAPRTWKSRHGWSSPRPKR